MLYNFRRGMNGVWMLLDPSHLEPWATMQANWVFWGCHAVRKSRHMSSRVWVLQSAVLAFESSQPRHQTWDWIIFRWFQTLGVTSKPPLPYPLPLSTPAQSSHLRRRHYWTRNKPYCLLLVRIPDSWNGCYKLLNFDVICYTETTTRTTSWITKKPNKTKEQPIDQQQQETQCYHLQARGTKKIVGIDAGQGSG